MLLEECTELLETTLDEDLTALLEDRTELLEATLDEDFAELLDAMLELDFSGSSNNRITRRISSVLLSESHTIIFSS